MSERKFTVLELHFHSHGDVQVGPRTIGTGGETRRGSRPGSRLRSRLRGRVGRAKSGGERRGIPIPLAAVVSVIAVAAALAWRSVQER